MTKNILQMFTMTATETEIMYKPAQPKSKFDMNNIQLWGSEGSEKSQDSFSTRTMHLWYNLPLNWLIPNCWAKAEWVFVPKEENSAGLSLLSVDGKISVIARRLTKYLLENKCIHIAVHKWW
jgi:hypothetical protein